MLNELFYKRLTIKNIIFITALALILFVAFKNMDITSMLFASIVIACSLNPIVNTLEKKMNRNIASALVLGLFILLLAGIIMPVLYMGLYEVSSFVDIIKKYINNMDKLIPQNDFMQIFGITPSNLNIQLEQVAQHVGDIFNGAITFIKNLSSAVLYLLISIIFTYFFLADKNTVKNGILRLFPPRNRKRTEEIFGIIAQKIGNYIIAQAYAIASVGIVMTIGLLLFRVDYAILLGLITAVLDIIPVIGPAIALVICLIVTSETGLLPIIGVIVSFTAAQLIENNFVRPYVYSKLLNIHPILIFIALFIGAKYLGVVGALLAPAMAAMICVLVEELYIKSIE
ncbi:AI-2E family transporter [bacterium]|nr:AI-2E family transporter [bacterium]